MPNEATQKGIDKQWERKAKWIEIENKRHYCKGNLKAIVKDLKKKIKEGKCGTDCQEEIKSDTALVKKNCGKKAAKKFEKDLGIKLKDNIVLKF